MSMKFKAGTYFVGDLAYAINNDNWQKLIKETNCFMKENITFKGVPIFIGSTANGDGYFYDQDDSEYNVCTGHIGVMPYDIVDHEPEYGEVIEWLEDFEVYEEDGIFYIGDLIIDTNDMDDEYGDCEEDE